MTMKPVKRIDFATAAPPLDKLPSVGESSYEDDDDEDADGHSDGSSPRASGSLDGLHHTNDPEMSSHASGGPASVTTSNSGKTSSLPNLLKRNMSSSNHSRPPTAASAAANNAYGAGGGAFGKWISRRHHGGRSSIYAADDEDEFESRERAYFARGLSHLDEGGSGAVSSDEDDEYESAITRIHHSHVRRKSKPGGAMEAMDGNEIVRIPSRASAANSNNDANGDGSVNAGEGRINNSSTHPAYDVRAYTATSGSGAASVAESDRVSDSETEDEDDGPEIDARYEWQHMLTNVLQGEVLKSEKTRISGTLAADLDDSSNSRKWRAYQIWIRVRAVIRGTPVQQEIDYLEEARGQIEGIWGEVAEFRVIDVEEAEEPIPEVYLPPAELSQQDQPKEVQSVTDMGDDIQAGHNGGSRQSSINGSLASTAVAPPSASEQIAMLIRKVEWSECLYPSIRALKAEKAYAAEGTTMNRIDALMSWQSISTRLTTQIGILQRWTGSSKLEVTQPGHEVIDEAATPSNDGVAQPVHRLVDASPFVERIFKEDGLQRTFEKNTIVDLYRVIHDAKSVMINCRIFFTEMNVPSYYQDLISLVHFPTNLIQEALKVRLTSVQNLSSDQQLSSVLVEQLTTDFREGLALAAKVKETFLEIMTPDLEHGWPGGTLNNEYDRVLLDALRFFFKLLNWTLRLGSKSTFLKETDIVENEWAFLSDSVEQIEGGDLLVGEHFCQVTHRLLARVSHYFESQLAILEERNMSDADFNRWLNQTLDNVRTRHRKLLRFGRLMQSRFENASEYTLDDINLNTFIHALAETEHFLVYTGSLESQAMYVIASNNLTTRQALLRKMLLKCFASGTLSDYADNEINNEEGHYLLVLTPRESFIWTGAVLNLEEVPVFDFDMAEGRVRLVADGTERRLVRCQKTFCDIFPAFREAIVVEAKAHLGRINRELKKTKRAEVKFAESILGGVDRLHLVLKERGGGQAALANYFSFVADLGQRSMKHMDPLPRAKYSLRLMQFSIKWVAFICDDCAPSDSRTFKWAVSALEFAMLMSRNENILRFSSEEFSLLRSKVASCMTLLISHFDILGARSSYQAKQEKDRLDVVRDEIRKQLRDTIMYLNNVEQLRASRSGTEQNTVVDAGLYFDAQDILDGLTKVRQRWLSSTMEIEQRRIELEGNMHVVGRVLDEERPEDKSLLFLAGSNSNISIRWQQGKFIGAGTFGSVYLAVNLDSGALMAVKEIKFQDLASAPNVIKQIRDEMLVMELLSHDNIVEYYGIEVHRDKVYIFEEYCQGGSLANLLEHGRIEDESVVQIYTLQMLDGLVYLHSMGIVHRDIKPDNILLNHMGVIKYVDFGAAKILAKNQKTLAAKTRAPGANGEVNSLTGTPMYMSPEVIKGDHRGRQGAMDIWSLGCVILECATGRRPWSNLDNEWAIMFHIGIATKHPPLPENGELSELGINFIETCLDIDPVARPTALELMEHPWIQNLKNAIASEMQITETIRPMDTVAEEEEEAYAEE